MTQFNPVRCKTPPFRHQVEDAQRLLDRPAFALWGEMGTGKTKIVIDAACALKEAGKIMNVVVVTPASVRSVWASQEHGELLKHCWLPHNVIEFHNPVRHLRTEQPPFTWVVTNYEFLRQRKHLEKLLQFCDRQRTLLVLDESSYIKNRTTSQTKAVFELRRHVARVVILNGTPIMNSPLDLWSQVCVLDRAIFKEFKNYYHFRARYAVMGGWHMKQVVVWQNLEHLAATIAPHGIRREKKDCLDLPAKLYTQREVALTHASWKRYKQLKQEAVMALGDGTLHLEPNAAVRILRLAQLTSGHLGNTYDPGKEDLYDPRQDATDETHLIKANCVDLSDEKLKWCVEYLTEESSAKAVIVWTRWRRERERLAELLKKSKEHLNVVELYGGQPKGQREQAIRMFTDMAQDLEGERHILVAQPHAGGFGLNLVAATEAIYLSNDYSLGIRQQSEDRCHRPGQKHPVTYLDVLATGPDGQKTVDHAILKALRSKEELAAWTCDRWRRELEDD